MVVWRLLTNDEDFSLYHFPIDADRAQLAHTIQRNPILSLLNEWEPIVILEKEVRNRPDFFMVEDEHICVSQRVVAALKPSPKIEFLPLLNDERQLYLLHVLPEPETVLDLERSIVERLSVNNEILRVIHFSFTPQAISNLEVFKIRGLPYDIFLSEAFKIRCEALGLKGLEFTQNEIVWTDEPLK